MTMNKIKEKLIHWLGGVTKEENVSIVRYEHTDGMLMAYDEVLAIMKKAYGMSAEEWAKYVYDNTVDNRDEHQWWHDRYKEKLPKFYK